MERNRFKERCDVRMAALNMTQDQLGELVGKPRQRLTEAFRGEMSPAAASLRVKMEHTLLEKINEKRIDMRFEVAEALANEPDLNIAKLSLILPEDLVYIVTEDGIPRGTWNPQTKSYTRFDK